MFYFLQAIFVVRLAGDLISVIIASPVEDSEIEYVKNRLLMA